MNHLEKIIPVTKKHIDQGAPSEPESCAIALALEAMNFEEISVDGENATFNIPVSVKLPKEARAFIAKFDSFDEENDVESEEIWDSRANAYIPNPNYGRKRSDVLKEFQLKLVLNGKAKMEFAGYKSTKKSTKKAGQKK